MSPERTSQTAAARRDSGSYRREACILDGVVQGGGVHVLRRVRRSHLTVRRSASSREISSWKPSSHLMRLVSATQCWRVARPQSRCSGRRSSGTATTSPSHPASPISLTHPAQDGGSGSPTLYTPPA